MGWTAEQKRAKRAADAAAAAAAGEVKRARGRPKKVVEVALSALDDRPSQARCSLLAARCSLLTTHDSRVATLDSSLSTRHSPTTGHLLPTRISPLATASLATHHTNSHRQHHQMSSSLSPLKRNWFSQISGILSTKTSRIPVPRLRQPHLPPAKKHATASCAVCSMREGTGRRAKHSRSACCPARRCMTPSARGATQRATSHPGLRGTRCINGTTCLASHKSRVCVRTAPMHLSHSRTHLSPVTLACASKSCFVPLAALSRPQAVPPYLRRSIIDSSVRQAMKRDTI